MSVTTFMSAASSFVKCRYHLFAEELGGEVHEVSSAATATTSVHLALEVHLHGHLARLL